MLSDDLLPHASSAPRRRARGPRSVPALSGHSPKNPKLAAEYAALKRALAARFREDREGYTKPRPRLSTTPTHGRGFRPVRFAMSGRARPRPNRAGHSLHVSSLSVGRRASLGRSPNTRRTRSSRTSTCPRRTPIRSTTRCSHRGCRRHRARGSAQASALLPQARRERRAAARGGARRQARDAAARVRPDQ